MSPHTIPVEALRTTERDLFEAPHAPRSLGVPSPQLRLSETEREYVVRVEVPGVKRGDLHVTCGERRVTVTGERRRAARGERTLADEFAYGPFSRTVETPQPFLNDRVRACSIDGVLEVHLPKVDPR